MFFQRHKNPSKSFMQSRLEMESRALGVAVPSQGRVDEMAALTSEGPSTIFNRVELPERLSLVDAARTAS